MEISTISSEDRVLPVAHQRDFQPPVQRRPIGARPRSSLLEHVHTVVLFAVLPCTVFWFPVLSSEVLGNMILSDTVLLLLWLTTLSILVRRTNLSVRIRRCVKLCVFAVLAGFCSAIGSLLFGQTANLASDVLRHMKVWGLPSIIPLGISLSSGARIGRLIAISAIVGATFNVAVEFTHSQEKLPLFTELSDLSSSVAYRIDDPNSRATGSVSNPNDFAYVCIIGLGFVGSLYFTAKRSAILLRLACLPFVAGLLYGLVASGSRSAIVGALGGAAYYVTKGKIGTLKKATLFAVLAVALVFGWRESSIFQERMSAAVIQGSEEANFAGRAAAQAIALRTWLAWPLGVGAANRRGATASYVSQSTTVAVVETSDSIYIDSLLTSGLEGFALLCLCLGTCWKLATDVPLTSRTAVIRATILAVFICGFASVAPATSFVAPFFFALAGVSAIPG